MENTLKTKHIEFIGKDASKTSIHKKGERDEQGYLYSPYLVDDDLKEVVNIAIELKRPLLIKGEPGCGKTRLAYAVKHELGFLYEEFHVKSTSRAQDVLYTYDTVGRLRDAQLAFTGRMKNADISGIDDPETYIHWGPLGKAFRNNKRTVVLIDEIDKADIDFPNDLLQELEELAFTVNEAGSEMKINANEPPIVFITSNDERDLPDAFLRRCLFYYIKFPAEKRLIEILQVHFPEKSEKVIKAVVSRFLKLRAEMEREKGMAGKKVSTSELIDWFEVLKNRHSDEEISMILGEELPYPSILLKSWDDHMRYLKPLKKRDH